MQIEQFANLLVAAVKEQNYEIRIQAANIYCEFLMQQPQQYLENCLQIIEAHNEISAIGAVVLKKNLTFNSNVSAIIRSGSVDFAQSILNRLLQQIINNNSYAHLITETAGELCIILLQAQTDITQAFEFCEFGLGSNDKTLNENSAFLIKYIAGCAMDHLKPVLERTMSIVNMVLQLDNPRVKYLGIMSLSSIICTAGFENELPFDLTPFLDQVIFQTQQLQNNKTFFLKALDELSELLGTSSTMFESKIDAILSISEQLLMSEDIDFFDIGVFFLQIVIESFDDVSDEQYQKEKQLLKIVIQFLNHVSDEYKQYVLSQPDYEEADDLNNIQPKTMTSLLQITTADYHLIKEVFDDLCENAEGNTPYMYVLTVSAILSSENYFSDDEMQGILQIFFEHIMNPDPSVQFRVINVIHFLFEAETSLIIKKKVATFLAQQGYFSDVLSLQVPIITQAAIACLSSIVRDQPSGFGFSCLPFASAIVTQIGGDLITDKVCMLLIAQLIQKTKSDEVTQYAKIFLQKLFEIVPNVNKSCSYIQVKYVKQLIATCTTVILTKQFEDVAPQFVDVLIQYDRGDIFEVDNSVVDQIYASFIELVDSYAQIFASADLDFLVKRLIDVLCVKYRNQDDTSIVDGYVTYNDFTINQHKLAVRLLEKLIIRFPNQLYKYSTDIIRGVQEAYGGYYDYAFCCSVYYQMPLFAIINQDPNSLNAFLQKLHQEKQKFFLDPTNRRSIDETVEIVKSMLALVEAYSQAQENEGFSYIMEILTHLLNETKVAFNKQIHDLEVQRDQEESSGEQDNIQHQMDTDIKIYWQQSDAVGDLANLCFRKQVLQQEMMELADNCGTDIIGAAILTQALRVGYGKQVAEHYFERFYKYYLDCAVKDRPISSFLCECCKQNCKTALHMTNGKELAEDIQDSVMMNYLLTFGVRTGDLETIVTCMQWLQENILEGGKKGVIRNIQEIMKGNQFAQIKEGVKEIAKQLYDGDPIEYEELSVFFAQQQ